MRKFTSTKGHEIGIHDVNERDARNDDAMTGYFLQPDGSEGGGLWFHAGALVDYDGMYCLPRPIAAALRAEGFQVDSDFDA